MTQTEKIILKCIKSNPDNLACVRKAIAVVGAMTNDERNQHHVPSVVADVCKKLTTCIRVRIDAAPGVIPSIDENERHAARETQARELEREDRAEGVQNLGYDFTDDAPDA